MDEEAVAGGLADDTPPAAPAPPIPPKGATSLTPGWPGTAGGLLAGLHRAPSLVRWAIWIGIGLLFGLALVRVF